MLGINKLFAGASVDVTGSVKQSKLSDSCDTRWSVAVIEAKQFRDGIFQHGAGRGWKQSLPIARC